MYASVFIVGCAAYLCCLRAGWGLASDEFASFDMAVVEGTHRGKLRKGKAAGEARGPNRTKRTEKSKTVIAPLFHGEGRRQTTFDSRGRTFATLRQGAFPHKRENDRRDVRFAQGIEGTIVKVGSLKSNVEVK